MKKNPNTWHTSPLTLLGGLSPETFLKEYWQKKPLLIRGAIPDFQGLLTPNELAGLACEDEVQSRLISFSKNQWKCEQGPFAEKRFTKLPERDWTLLVQTLNHHMQEATDLLQAFNFIPHARLDDLMVSYAPDGGGVGPHFDSYDVFLLQGCGQRIWRISEQEDLTLVEGAPLRILQNFKSEQEWTLSAGDMLYLPPHVAHWGVAVGDCMTYSIGFRAPSAQELAGEFLSYLQENLQMTGRYVDPDLRLQEHPAEIGDAMVKNVMSMLSDLRWDGQNVADFLGQYLTEPKHDVVFEAPAYLSEKAFAKRALLEGIQLNFKSQLMFVNQDFYLNGEKLEIGLDASLLLGRLADNRSLSAADLGEANAELMALIYEWYLMAYVIF